MILQNQILNFIIQNFIRIISRSIINNQYLKNIFSLNFSSTTLNLFKIIGIFSASLKHGITIVKRGDKSWLPFLIFPIYFLKTKNLIPIKLNIAEKMVEIKNEI